ncbi:hypothetical protein CEE37_03050 [candidate division LCP-89 bacterium B3_LCP]|uniref:NAD-dependent epimerase/dehydratase domain-containing protein n=1 Tax=candidate division LCP-89 bacterium B3_LCP TaxID=2012998 RepID=A0A532V3I2_UNCL8|nr:MAG: hypothetical protein CEE37_03050 [candidate division LCP-89 bacterium B3_LCP]
MGKWLVTGATGFIGGQIARYLVQKEIDIRLLVRKPEKLSDDLKSTADVIQGDLTDSGSLDPAFADVEVIINAAGLLGLWGNTYNQLFKVNAKGVENLITASFKNGVKRFIHLSAGGVTGPVGADAVDESYPPQPVTDYEKTKWAGEKQALGIAHQRDLNLLVLRPTFTYGPGDPHKLNLFRAVKKGMFAFIGDGSSTVHPVYVTDLVEAVYTAAHSEKKGRAYIIGGERPITKKELIFGIADCLGVRRPSLKIPTPVANALAKGCETAARIIPFTPPLTRSRVMALSCNWGYSIEAARIDLGYNPKVDLSEGLRRTIGWYREHGWL